MRKRRFKVVAASLGAESQIQAVAKSDDRLIPVRKCGRRFLPTSTPMFRLDRPNAREDNDHLASTVDPVRPNVPVPQSGRIVAGANPPLDSVFRASLKMPGSGRS